MQFIIIILMEGEQMKNKNSTLNPFWVIVKKEISDTVKSWRFIIMIAIVALTCMGSLYTALDNFSSAVNAADPEDSFFFLKLFTLSDGTLPSFIVFISFLGPLLGISLGFDCINQVVMPVIFHVTWTQHCLIHSGSSTSSWMSLLYSLI